jgi:multiple sugar transport system ATP-binding protein
MMLEAEVEMTEPTGAETIVMLRVAGQRAIGRVAADMVLPVGSMQRFSIDTRKLCLFDPESERLIA